KAPAAGLTHGHHAASAHLMHDEGPADPCAACTAGLDCHCSAPALLHAAVLVSPSLPPVPAMAGDRPQLTGVRGGAIWRPPTFC
ncbi:hypothetical protein, partial [Immundisolibacter sp.]|uniref:hypothetical protein n=1 Tax=Immundisolibacter sp. TaxID=1934948 RepID=UPI003F876EE7